MSAKDRVRLLHMFEAARKIEQYSAGKTREAFYEDEMLRLALTTLFQNIGEAARKVEDEFKAMHPEFEWDDIVNFRHRLVHAYNVIDYDIMWDIIQTDVPVLLQCLVNLDIVEKP